MLNGGETLICSTGLMEAMYILMKSGCSLVDFVLFITRFATAATYRDD